MEVGFVVFGLYFEGKFWLMFFIGYLMDDVEWCFVGGVMEMEGVLELCIEVLMCGYFNWLEVDCECFVDGWYKMNDVMCCDDDGFFYFVLCVDDMFVCGGENIFLSEVEELLYCYLEV